MANFVPSTMHSQKLKIGGKHELNVAHDRVFRKTLEQENFIRSMFSRGYINKAKSVNGGKAVEIEVPRLVGNATIQDYTVYQGVASTDKFEVVHDKFTIENHKAINVEMDLIELQLTEPDTALEINRKTAQAYAEFMEAEAVNALLTSGTISTNHVPSTATTIYSDILAEKEKLMAQNVKVDNMVLVVTPATYTLLKKSTEITSIENGVSDDVYQELRKRGIMTQIDGTPIMIAKTQLAGKNVDFILVDFGVCEDLSLINPDGGLKVVNLESKLEWDTAHLRGRFIYDFIITERLAVLIKKNA